MNYFGFTLGSGLVLGDKRWMKAFGWNHIEEFVPDVSGWRKLFDLLQNIIDSSKLPKDIGACFHLLSRIPRILIGMGFVDDFLAAVDEFKMRRPFQLGLHSRHADPEVICSPKFLETFADDLMVAEKIKTSVLVEHPPIGTKDTKQEAVDILTSPEVISLMDKHQGFSLCWENKADYQHKRRFFGSLKQMVLFRELLAEKLKNMNRDDLISRHKFCLDTGHLLIWRYTHENRKQADEEIEEYLPEYSQYLRCFHYQCNDGIVDAHMTPFSRQFMDHKSRKKLDQDLFFENFSVLRNWIKIVEKNGKEKDIHQHLEAQRLPFSYSQYIEFADELTDLIS